MIKLEIFKNDINNSNCYVVQDTKSGKGFIIDPGSRSVNHIMEFLRKDKLELDFIILTHSHFDHIAGVGSLKSNIPAKIISSKLCSDKIIDPIKNLSYFTDYGIIVSPKADILVEDLENGRIKWNNYSISFYNSPGHTKCSICIQFENMFFTGDTLLKGLKTKLTHPDGKREEIRKTLKHIYETMPGYLTVFPGHGDSFILETQDLSVAMNK